ncbi:MAG TPA: biliverdin-producing heme oxygenase [Kofleriaceae bacterium]|jgi:heme oxygenase
MQRLSRTLIRLNLATRQYHTRADAGWLDLRRPSVVKQDYVEQLIKVYGFEAPLESALRYTPGVQPLVDLRARMRAGLIVQDLVRLGLGPGRIAALPQRFISFATAAEALGWMYVVERATLIHGSVRRYLMVRIPEASRASSYLAAYDGVAAARWSNFGSALDAVAQSPDVENQVLRAANQGFAALCAWLAVSQTYSAVGT